MKSMWLIRRAAALIVVAALCSGAPEAPDGRDDSDVVVFVNADILLLGAGGEQGVSVREKLAVGNWEECAAACSEHTCCTGFVFGAGEHTAPFGRCRIVEGAHLEPPAPAHLKDGSVSGLLKGRPVPPECAAAEAGGTDVTLVFSLIDAGAGAAGDSTLDDHAYWGLVAVLELRLPAVLITQRALLPRLTPLLHKEVRVVLVADDTAVRPLEGTGQEYHVAGHAHLFGPAGQEPLDMFPFAQEWQRAAANATLNLQKAESGGETPDACHAEALDPATVRMRQLAWNKVSWLYWSARVNPWHKF